MKYIWTLYHCSTPTTLTFTSAVNVLTCSTLKPDVPGTDWKNRSVRAR